MIILVICNAIPHLRSTLLRTSAAPTAPLHEVLCTSEPSEIMFLLQSLHLQWTTQKWQRKLGRGSGIYGRTHGGDPVPGSNLEILKQLPKAFSAGT